MQHRIAVSVRTNIHTRPTLTQKRVLAWIRIEPMVFKFRRKRYHSQRARLGNVLWNVSSSPTVNSGVRLMGLASLATMYQIANGDIPVAFQLLSELLYCTSPDQ
jgi:hypothetical protein